MRGHEKIIEMRCSGKAPRFVFINDFNCQADWFETGEHATICTAGDSIELLDMRFLIGLRVSISSTIEARAKALFELCLKAGAHAVAACHVQVDRKRWEQSGWAEVWNREVAEVA